jgi:peptidyl-prolyl cis-trans isomerase D
MLSQMREGRFIKTVLWIVVVAFVVSMVFVWGADLQGSGCSSVAPQGEQWVGKVGKVGLSLRDYDQRYRNGRSQLTQNRQPGQALTADELLRLQDQVFEQMVNETLFQLEVDRLGLTPSESEIGDVLQFDPPELLRQQFRNEQGVFDRNAYELALNNPNIDWTPFENYVRSSLPSERLQSMLVSSVHVGEGEIRAEFERRFRKITVGYAGQVWRDIELTGEDPDDATLRAFLAENADDYQQEERFRITAVKLSRDPSPSDEEYVRGRMDFLRGEIEGGKAFEQMAKEWSQDLANAELGGDLGWFGLGRMDPVFEEAAFALTEGEVSQPVRSSFGFHLIKLDGRRDESGAEEISARHILLRVEPSYATLDSIQALSDSLFTRTESGGSLADASAGLGIEILNPAPFGARESIEGLGFNSAVKARVARLEAGEVTRRFSARDADYMIQLDEKIPASSGDFDTLRDRLLAAWREDQQRTQAREKAEALLAAIQSGRSLAEVAKSQDLEYKLSEPFSRRDYIPGIGPEGAFQGAAFILNLGDVSGVIEAQQGAFVLEVTAKPESDKELYATEREGIRDRLLNSAQQRYFMSWMDNLKERFPVEDFRDQFYN